MSEFPTTESVPISTFTTSRTAARPRVIPLYATSVSRRARRPLILHHNLPPKPYARPKPVHVNMSSASGISSEEPGSPLTPVDDAFSTDTGCDATPEARPIFIPQPNNPNINRVGWAPASLKAYRSKAREAVERYLDHHISLASQDTTALAKAIDHVESVAVFFKVHEDHWGARLLLRDQLKSVKDTRTKAEALSLSVRLGVKRRQGASRLIKARQLRTFASSIPNSRNLVQLQQAASNPRYTSSTLFTLLPHSLQYATNSQVPSSFRGFHISTLNTTTPIDISTVSTRLARYQDVIRLPLVESGFEGWPAPQAYIHDIDVIYRRCRYRVFFQRHKKLRRNPVLRIAGDLVVMRVGSRNIQNVVNPRARDSVRIRTLAKR
ncbi:hypothetical protein F5880DRAFT_1610691 [Lentinula raphanica]|nr:hypothetical protein F5880DRAFT_1610691 [Lentinula raphanica]